jgi:hypothetical protein
MALTFCHSVQGQTTTPALKHFAAHGLSFDYPATIELDDRSTSIGQHLIIQSKGRAQIMVVSRFAQINTATELADARHEVVDSFIETIWKQVLEDDPNVSRAEARIEIGGAPATGIRMRAVLNNEPGNAEIYSLQLGSRLVVVSLIGSDREIAATAPAWLAIRGSLKIEAANVAQVVNLRSGTQINNLRYISKAISTREEFGSRTSDHRTSERN